MSFAHNLQTAFKKIKAEDKNNAANQLTPMERQAVIILSTVVIFPLLISGVMLFIN